MKRALSLIIVSLIAISLLGPVGSNAYTKYDSLSDYGDATNSALFMIQGDGADLFTRDDSGLQNATVDYLFMNKDTVHGPFSTLSFSGWFGANLDIVKVGYAIGEEEPVFSEDYKAGFPSWGTQTGVKYAIGYDMTIDVSGLGEEKTLIKPVVMLEDGTVLEATFLTVYYSSKPAEIEKLPEIIELTTGSTGAFNFRSAKSVAFKINIPEGKKLVKFTVKSSPTWNGPATGVGLTATIYKWAGDFEDSIDGDSLGEFFEEDHKDNANLDVVYDYIPAGDYLIVMTDYTGNIGGWNAEKFIDEYATLFDYFIDGMESAPPVNCAITIIDDDPPETTDVPATDVPTDAPATDAPTEEAAPTDAPAVTDVPQVTDAPKTTDAPKDKDQKGANAGLIAGITAGSVAVAAAAVIAGVTISKKRKKQK